MGVQNTKNLSCCSEGRLITEGDEEKNGIYKDIKFYKSSFYIESCNTEEDDVNISTKDPSVQPSNRNSSIFLENNRERNMFTFEQKIREKLDNCQDNKKNISLETLTKVSAIIEENENSQAQQQPQENNQFEQCDTESSVVSELIHSIVSQKLCKELNQSISGKITQEVENSIINYDIFSELLIDEDNMIDSLCQSMQQITKNIWIGNKTSVGYTIGDENEKTIKEKENAKQQLKDNNIQHILVCCENYQQFSDKEFNYYQYQIPDDPQFDIKNALEKSSQILEQIENNNQIAIVHCSAGASRSATIVIGYLMKHYRKKFEVVRNYVLDKRNCINVCNFEKNLKEWEEQIFNEK